MRVVRANVRRGRMIVDEPTDLPDGAEIELQLGDEDDLDAAERAALEASIDRGIADAKAGRVRRAEHVLRESSG